MDTGNIKLMDLKKKSAILLFAVMFLLLEITRSGHGPLPHNVYATG
jgi:hypothetical protein